MVTYNNMDDFFGCFKNFLRLYFLEQSKVHNRTERKVQRFPT